MKKFLKILFIVLLVLFIVVLTLPFVFKGEIMKLAKQEINNTVKAEVEWTDFRISLFKGFPDLKVTMDNMSVIGIEEFEGDTLLAFDAFSVKVDLISAFSGNVKVKSVILDKPVMRAIAIDSVTVNWDIMYPSQDVQEEEEVEDTSEMDLNVELREFIIRDASIRYSDLEGDMFAGIENFNFLLSGNFAMDYTDLDVETWSDEITVEIGGVKYLNKAFFGFEGLLGADLINYKFTLNENELKLNEIVLGLEGFFNITNESAYEVDVDFSTKETQFKSLLSMVPAMYMADFEGLETSGSLSLNGSAKGMISDEEYPKVNMNLLVKDGFFAYPDLPKNASDIQIDLKVFYDGVFADNSKIDLDKFHVKLGGNPVDMNFHVITPESDMQMSGAVNGNIDLATLADVIPMEDAQLDGAVKMNIEMMGRMSDIENENYEAFRADGLLEITNVVAEGADIPIPVEIEKTTMLFSPQYVDLQTFEATIGSSDIQMSGKLENFIPYVFKDETIRGELVLNSSLLNLNELMIESTDEPEDVIEDTLELSVVEIPQNIDFTFNSKLDKVIYDQLEVENVIGRIYTREGKVVMDMLSMDLLDGSMILNGEYNTQDITTPMIDMGMKMTNIDIGKSFEAFNTIQKLAPVAKMCRGNVSVDFDFSSFLDSTMSPVMNSIVGSGRLQTNEVKI